MGDAKGSCGKRLEHVAVIGSLSEDRIMQQGMTRRRLGGVVVYAGLCYRRRDLPTIAVFNHPGSRAVDYVSLERHGLEVDVGGSDSVTSCWNFLDGEERRQRIPECARPIDRQDLERAVEGCRLVHLGPLHPEDIDVGALSGLGESGRVALDVQGIVRSLDQFGDVTLTPSAGCGSYLEACSMVKASEEELRALEIEFGASVHALIERFRVDELVETRGSRGGRIHRPGMTPLDYSAVTVDRLVDPTGAGDVFFAEYLYHRIWSELPCDEAARLAAETAAAQVAGRFLDLAGLDLP